MISASAVIFIAAGIGFIVGITSLILVHKIKNERYTAILSGSPCIIMIGTAVILLTSHSDYQIDEALFIIPFSIINDLLFFAYWKYDTLYFNCLCCPPRNTITTIFIGLPMGYAVWCIYTLIMYYVLRRVAIPILFIRLLSILMIVLTATTGLIGIIHEVWMYHIGHANVSRNYHQQSSSEDAAWSDDHALRAVGNSIMNNNGDIAMDSPDDEANPDVVPSDDSDGKEIEDDNFEFDNPVTVDHHGNGYQHVLMQQQQVNHNGGPQFIQRSMDIKEVAENKLPISVYLGRGIMTFFAICMVGLFSYWGDGILAGFFCVFPSIYSIMVAFLYSKYRRCVEFDTLYANILTKTADNIFVILSGILYLDLGLDVISTMLIAWTLSTLFITIPISYLYSWRDKQIQKPELTILRKYISFNL